MIAVSSSGGVNTICGIGRKKNLKLRKNPVVEINWKTIDLETKCGDCGCTLADHVKTWMKEEQITAREAILDEVAIGGDVNCDWCFSHFNDNSGHAFVVAV